MPNSNSSIFFWSFEDSLHILDISPWLDVQFANTVFSQSVPFHFLTRTFFFFLKEKVLILLRSILLVFTFRDYVFGVKANNSLLKDFLLSFF